VDDTLQDALAKRAKHAAFPHGEKQLNTDAKFFYCFSQAVEQLCITNTKLFYCFSPWEKLYDPYVGLYRT